MSFYIGIKELAANGLIEMLKINKMNRFISYKQIEDYGNIIANSSDEDIILTLSRNDTVQLLHKYYDFFEEGYNDKGELGIRLKEGKDIHDLIKKFRTYLSIDLLLKFMNANIIKKANIA